MLENKRCILIADDEKRMVRAIKDYLSAKDFYILEAYDGEETLSVYYKYNQNIDLILLDVMMPEIDGLSFCENIRPIVDCPIIFLTAKTMENDITAGLSIGGDDYLTKPFRISELRARINAHLRRERRDKHISLYLGRIKLNLSSKEMMIDDNVLSLTKSEYCICEYLAKNKGQVFTKEQIYDAAFGIYGESDISVITTHIKNIRAKLDDYGVEPIKTVWGIGYKWV